MIPRNTLTFQPADARALESSLKEKGVTILKETKPGNGPAHFMIEDPDGNPLLFDQP